MYYLVLHLAARICGQKPKDSLYLGAFMNTRGLMELVVLAIGYQMHILPPKIYAVLVLMTVVTTVMTMPMIHLINVLADKIEKQRAKRLPAPGIELVKFGTYRVLLPFGRPRSGATLLRLCDLLLRRGQVSPRVTALHITTDKDINPIDADKYFEDSFAPISHEAERLGQDITMDYQVSEEIEQTIISKLRQEHYNLLLVGAGIKYSAEAGDQEAASLRAKLSGWIGSLSIATTERLLAIGHLVRDKMNYFVEHAPCSVGIFLERDFSHIGKVLLRLDQADDVRLLPYARTLIENNPEARLYIQSTETSLDDNTLGIDGLKCLRASDNDATDTNHNSSYDLLILSYQTWTSSYDQYPELLSTIPSTLILSLKVPIH